MAGSGGRRSTPPDGAELEVTPQGDADDLLGSLQEAEVADALAGELVDDSGDFAWESALGETRHESVHLPLFGGIVRTVRVHRAVNLGTHPELRDRCLQGTLNDLDGGESLAVSYWLHDPEARKLAIAVPEVLRHEALRERARFLEALADDVEEAVPPYVLEARLVIGQGELAEYLDESPPIDRLPALRQHAALLTVRENHISAWERQLEEREHVLDVREDELDTLEEDLALTEEELLARARDLDDRVEEARLMELGVDDAIDLGATNRDDASAMLDELAGPTGDGMDSEGPSLVSDVELVDEAPEPVPSDVMALDDEAGDEPLEPPARLFEGDAAADALAAQLGADGVLVFARLAPQRLGAFGGRDVTLRMEPDGGLFKLSLSAGSATPVAVDLDPADADDHAVLERLTKPYVATVQIHRPDGSHEATVALRGRGFASIRDALVS